MDIYDNPYLWSVPGNVPEGRAATLMPVAPVLAGVYGLELAGEDDAFAAREAGSAAAAVDVVAPGLAVAGSVNPDRVRVLAYTRRACRLVGRTDASVASARALLTAASLDVDRDDRGVRADQGKRAERGTVAVRARDVRSTAGVSTGEAERELGDVLVERGFAVDLDDPDHELLALFSDDVCLLGWTAAESVRDFGDRRPTDRPFFQPGSMDPLDARAVANIAGAGPGTLLVDPMCGTGGVLVEAGLVGARVVGLDAQPKMVRGARRNLDAFLADGDGAPTRDGADGRDDAAGDDGALPTPGDADVLRGDAAALPLRDGAADGVVFDAPYGRQSRIERHDLADLLAGALGEARRVAPRAVVVADRSWREAALEAGWRVESLFERRVHRSLVRHVHVLVDPSDATDVGGTMPDTSTSDSA